LTDFESLDFATVVADGLKNFLDLLKKAIMIDRSVQLDDTKMTWALGLIFFAGRASEVSIDGTEMRIVRTFLTRSEALIIPGRALELQ
jgi:hypothetical protein